MYVREHNKIMFITRAALLIGVLILAQGIYGLATPDGFLALVAYFQGPPIIYLAAVIRFAIGVVLVLAARSSRHALALRILGLMIAIGGVLTPFFGMQFADVVLGWWVNGGSAVVRLWALGSGLLGVFIIHANLATRRIGRSA
jgi:hypothetical protein